MVEKKNLIILPYAGSTVRDLTGFMDLFEGRINCQTLEYAGHGSRGREKLYDTWDEMVTDTAVQLERMTEPDREYALLGYSMGSLILYELLAQKLPRFRVSRAFFCAHTPKETPRASDHYYHLTDAEFLEKMHQMGGMKKIEEKMLENRVFKRVYFDPIRNDFRLIGEYARKEKQEYERLAIPGHILYCPEDTASELIQGWDRLFETETEKLALGSNHFFIWEKGKEMAEYIISRLEK